MSEYKLLFYPKLHRRHSYSKREDGNYYSYDYYRRKFSDEIREDCACRCVYCDLHENSCGGRDAMNADHFRPRGLPQFASLENDPANLVWACPVCNRLKSDTWPCTDISRTVENSKGFIDPFSENRIDYFEVDESGELIPIKPPAAFLILQLALNRHHCRISRRARIIRFECIKTLREVREYIKTLPPEELRRKNLELLNQMMLRFEAYLDVSEERC